MAMRNDRIVQVAKQAGQIESYHDFRRENIATAQRHIEDASVMAQRSRKQVVGDELD